MPVNSWDFTLITSKSNGVRDEPLDFSDSGQERKDRECLGIEMYLGKRAYGRLMER